jgi:DNA-directed RNA polymerase specialized sigma24 family protein
MWVPSADDEELDLQARIGLLGTDEEREQAIALLFTRFERPLMKFLADRFSDLPSDDRASVIHYAFVAVHDKAVNRTLDVDSPLHPLLFTIAQRRAIDRRRMASCRIRADVELTEEVASYLAGTETGRDWRLVVTLGKAGEVKDEFRQFVGMLKGQQRRVASVMADFLPDWLTDQEIADEVFVRTKLKITVMEVKGAKNALMAKFRSILKRKLA